MWWLDDILRSQFGRPSGLIGSLVVGPALNLSSVPIVNAVLDRLEVKPGESVLDVGFGPGYSILATARRLPRGRVVGIDYSPEMVQMTARLLRGEAHARLSCADVLHLPFRRSVFHKALTVNSIYYWPDCTAGLREIARVVRPNGRLAVGVRSPSRLRPITSTWDRFQLYEPEEISRMMEAAGFRVLSAQRMDRWLPLDTVVILGERT